MVISPGYTVDEIRVLLHEYELIGHGGKKAWRLEHGVTDRMVNKWRRAIYGGDLDRGLIARETVHMSPLERRLKAQHDPTIGQLAEIARLNARIEELEATNDVLGKAIGLLHKLSEHEPDTPPMSEPTSS